MVTQLSRWYFREFPQTMYAQPDYPAALMSLQGMDSDQLKEILNNEDKFDNFMKELPQVKALVNEKVSLTEPDPVRTDKM